MQLDGCQITSRSAGVIGIVDSVLTNDESASVFFEFVGFLLDYNPPICYLC